MAMRPGLPTSMRWTIAIITDLICEIEFMFMDELESMLALDLLVSLFMKWFYVIFQSYTCKVKHLANKLN